MSFLNEINQASSSLVEEKPLLKVQELPQEEKFKIIGLKIVNTRFGEAILAELDHSKVFLPKRVTEVYKAHLEEFSKNTYFLEYLGLQELPKGLKPRVLFKISPQ